MGALQNQRGGARDTGSWGPLPGQRFTDLCLINTLIFFFKCLRIFSDYMFSCWIQTLRRSFLLKIGIVGNSYCPCGVPRLQLSLEACAIFSCLWLLLFLSAHWLWWAGDLNLPRPEFLYRCFFSQQLWHLSVQFNMSLYSSFLDKRNMLYSLYARNHAVLL